MSRSPWAGHRPDGRFDGRATALSAERRGPDHLCFDPAPSTRYVNIAETRTDGVELEGRALLGGGFDLTLAYAWTDADDARHGRPAAARAGTRRLGHPGLDRRSSVGGPDRPGRGRSGRTAGGVRDGFVTANLNAAYALTDEVTLTARIENLADERYQQVLGYGEPGRSGYVGIRLRY